MERKYEVPGRYIVPRITLDSQLRTSTRAFSILSTSRATIEELTAAWAVYKGKGVEFRDIVPLTPDRVILHELAAVMQCFIKQELDPGKGEEVFKEMVLKAFIKLKDGSIPEYGEAIKKMDKDYEELNDSIIDYIKNPNIPGVLTSDEQALVGELLKKAKGNRDELPNAEKDGVIAGIRAILYMQRARQYAYHLARTVLVEQSSLSQLPLLSKQKDSIAIFTVGGPASGKTSSLVKIAESIESTYGIKWDEIAHHNLDRARTILLEPEKDSLDFGSLTSDEARLVKERELKLMITLSATEGKFRHQLYDGSEIDSKAFKQHAMHGKATMVCLVSTHFETALERAYLRGQSENRYVPIDSLLQTHKNGPQSLIKALDQDGIEGTNTTVLMYDNNVERGKDSILFGTINAQTKEIIIKDPEKMKSWLKKSNLNTSIDFPKVYSPDAVHSIELYTGEEMTIEKYFEPLVKRGYKLTMEPTPQVTYTGMV
ncbi:coiled-coil protein [Legionella lansingensis]|uniref:Coiled-coil protein n=1 Tax=Legionella lansingensis TaxID=45067 RepID=A0A0W0VT98_9GAMM|nr:zeta toxin family protein [Legionella lansingensis]KTD23476.1 coiled-coil protein [Legionella lansingensis]SNV50792.1 coiled-coil protein [Legionella lansingensis]